MAANPRYQIPNKLASLSATFFTEFNSRSMNSVFVDSVAINQSSNHPVLGMFTREIYTVYDSESKTVSLYSRYDNDYHGEPRKIKLATQALGQTSAREFGDRALITVASCISAETLFLNGAYPPSKTKSYFYFLPRYRPTKICKNRVILVEAIAGSQQDSIECLRETKISLKSMREVNVTSGTMIHMNLSKEMHGEEERVDYIYRQKTYRVRRTMAEALGSMLRPHPQEVVALMTYEDVTSRYDTNLDLVMETFFTHMKEKKTFKFLWVMLQYSICFGDREIIDRLSYNISFHVETKMKEGGFDEVRSEFGF